MTTFILGQGGHAKVLAQHFLPDVRTVGIDDHDPDQDGTIIIGVGDLKKRKELWYKYRPTHYIGNVIADSAIMSMQTKIRMWKVWGLQILDGVVIQPDVTIGENTLINTRASIDHDCVIGAHCFVAPGAILCGDVKIGDDCFIGAGATIVQGVNIDDGTFVPAGTLVVGQDDMRKPIAALRGNGKVAAFCREAFTATEVSNPSGFGTDTNP